MVDQPVEQIFKIFWSETANALQQILCKKIKAFNLTGEVLLNVELTQLKLPDNMILEKVLHRDSPENRSELIKPVILLVRITLKECLPK